MNTSWALYILEAESVLHSEGQGLPIPLDMIDAAVDAAPQIAEVEYSYVPSVAAALKRRKRKP